MEGITNIIILFCLLIGNKKMNWVHHQYPAAFILTHYEGLGHLSQICHMLDITQVNTLPEDGKTIHSSGVTGCLPHPTPLSWWSPLRLAMRPAATRGECQNGEDSWAVAMREGDSVAMGSWICQRPGTPSPGGLTRLIKISSVPAKTNPPTKEWAIATWPLSCCVRWTRPSCPIQVPC